MHLKRRRIPCPTLPDNMSKEDKPPPPDQFLVDALPTLESEKARLSNLGYKQFYYYKQYLKPADPAKGGKPLDFDENNLPSPAGVAEPFLPPPKSELRKKQSDIRTRDPYWAGLAYFDGTSTKVCSTFPTWLPRTRATALWWRGLVIHFQRREGFFEDPELAEFGVLEQAWAELERACSFAGPARSAELSEQARLAGDAKNYIQEVARRLFEMEGERPDDDFSELWSLIARAFAGGRLTERALIAPNRKLTIAAQKQKESGGRKPGYRGYKNVIADYLDRYVAGKHKSPDNAWVLIAYMEQHCAVKSGPEGYIIGAETRSPDTFEHAVARVIRDRKTSDGN